MIAILLMGFGGPGSIEDVEPMVKGMDFGRPVTDEYVNKFVERYRKIGGKSPLLEITQKQASALEMILNDGDDDFRLFVGMRYGHPYIEEAIDEIIDDKPEYLIAISLSPYFTKATSGGYFIKLDEALQGSDLTTNVAKVYSFYDHPKFISALVDTLMSGLDTASSNGCPEPEVVFTAHGLPTRIIESGDPYADQVTETVDLVAKQAGLVSWSLAWQSGRRDGSWLEPDIKVVVEDLVGKGSRGILAVPVGFVTENIETLFDLDIETKGLVESRGAMFFRAPCLNTSPMFIEALKEIVIDQVSKKGES